MRGPRRLERRGDRFGDALALGRSTNCYPGAVMHRSAPAVGETQRTLTDDDTDRFQPTTRTRSRRVTEDHARAGGQVEDGTCPAWSVLLCLTATVNLPLPSGSVWISAHTSAAASLYRSSPSRKTPHKATAAGPGLRNRHSVKPAQFRDASVTVRAEAVCFSRLPSPGWWVGGGLPFANTRPAAGRRQTVARCR